MLQSGGANNTSAALLRQYFAHEQRCEDHARRVIAKSGGHSPRGNRTGILPIITANTDIASLRRTRSPRKSTSQQSPRGTANSGAQYPLPYELPKQGIGYKVDEVSPPPSAEGSMRGVKVMPSHGKLPPYGRRMITKEFYDDVSGGGIACLHPQHTAATESPRRSAKIAHH